MSLAVNTIPTPYIHVVVKRRKNTWYTVKDGNWTDPLVWESNAIRRWNYPGQNITSPVFPQVGDDVYIGHTVTLNAGTSSIPVVVNNLYIAGTFKADNSSRQINVNGDIQATGSVDFTSSNVNLVLYGVNNYIVSFTSGTASTVTYTRGGDQPIMDLSYRNLAINGIGIKYVQANMVLTGNLTIGVLSKIEVGSYDMTVTGSTTMSVGTFSKNDSGSLLFIGNLNADNGTMSLTGNPTVETRGNVSMQVTRLTSGTGTWSFTTNNQTIFITTIICQFDGQVIVSGITLTLTGSAAMQINNSIDGSSVGSSLIHKGVLYLNTTTAPMVTGSFDKDSFANTIGYIMNATFTIPYSTFSTLIIQSSGTKTLSANTTVASTLTISGSGTLDTSTFSLTVSGATTLNIGTLAISSSSGSALFTGLFTISNGGVSTVSGSTIECKSGVSTAGSVVLSWNGTLILSTNNQTFSIGAITVLACDILISGAITTTITGGTVTFNGVINGNNASSILDNRSTALNYKNATAPMVTGKLYCNQAANTWFYDLAGNQDIQPPSDPVSPGYSSLTLAGSGAKKLLGNVSVKATYTLTSPATLDLNGFALTNP